jgi:hypothetical protein
MLLIGTQYPGLKSVEWSDWQSGNILDYQALLFDCQSSSFTPSQSALREPLSVFVGQGHSVFVILPTVSGKLKLDFLPAFDVTVYAQRGETIAVKHPLPPFDKYNEALKGHEIFFVLQNVSPYPPPYVETVVNNVNMALCAKYHNVYLFHPPARDKAAKALEIIISFFKPEFEECQPDPTPSWGEDLIATIPGTRDVKTQLQEIDARINDLEGQRGSKEKELQGLGEWGQLLWLTGIPLQRVVQKAFKYLGFEVEPRPETGHTEDFVAKHGDGVYLIEATGSSGSILVEKGRQLMEWVVASEVENCRGVLIGNAFSKDPPDKRPPTPNHHIFSPDLQRYAARHSFSLLETRELFGVVCAKLANQPVPVESLCAALRKVGIVTFPQRTQQPR